MRDTTPILSICTTCRDGRETSHDVRGGTRLGQSVLARMNGQAPPQIRLRGVRCMSQCKRPCIVSLSAEGRFTYVFGDLDPEQDDHIDALLDLVPLYRNSEEGFLERQDRPEPLRARILGRFPPSGSLSPLISSIEALEL